MTRPDRGATLFLAVYTIVCGFLMAGGVAAFYGFTKPAPVVEADAPAVRQGVQWVGPR